MQRELLVGGRGTSGSREARAPAKKFGGKTGKPPKGSPSADPQAQVDPGPLDRHVAWGSRFRFRSSSRTMPFCISLFLL
jgi:hypothetical protein